MHFYSNNPWNLWTCAISRGINKSMYYKSHKMLLLGFLYVLLVGRTGASLIRDCINVNGTLYYGNKTISSSGEKCLNWMNVSKTYNLTISCGSNPGSWDHNYCRNADSLLSPWCFVASEEGVRRHNCVLDPCQDETTGVSDRVEVTSSGEGQTKPQSPHPPSRESVAAKLDPGINRRVRFGPKRKKDLGTLGYALGALLMAMIVLLGSGITMGYFYRKGLKLKIQQEQRAYEQELHRINLPLSAFSNLTCDLTDEKGETERGDHDHAIHMSGFEKEEESELKKEG